MLLLNNIEYYMNLCRIVDKKNGAQTTKKKERMRKKEEGTWADILCFAYFEPVKEKGSIVFKSMTENGCKLWN